MDFLVVRVLFFILLQFTFQAFELYDFLEFEKLLNFYYFIEGAH